LIDDPIFRTHAVFVYIRTLSVIIAKNKMCQYCSLFHPINIKTGVIQ
jgi:hypothetical protein